MILYFLISAGRLVRALAATQPPGRCRFYKCRIDLDTSSGIHHFNQYRNEEITMDSTSAIDALGALAQEHRLALFRLLAHAGGRGMAAGAIAVALVVTNRSLSFPLDPLRGAGMTDPELPHRTTIYRANSPRMHRLCYSPREHTI